MIRRQDLQRREAIFAGDGWAARPATSAPTQKLVKATAPPGVRFDVGGATREQQDAFAAMLGAMGLAVMPSTSCWPASSAASCSQIAIMASLPLCR